MLSVPFTDIYFKRSITIIESLICYIVLYYATFRAMMYPSNDATAVSVPKTCVVESELKLTICPVPRQFTNNVKTETDRHIPMTNVQWPCPHVST